METAVSIKALSEKLNLSKNTVVREAERMGIVLTKLRAPNNQVMNTMTAKDAEKIVKELEKRSANVLVDEISVHDAAEKVGLTVTGLRKKLDALDIKVAIRRLPSGQVGMVLKTKDFEKVKLTAKTFVEAKVV